MQRVTPTACVAAVVAVRLAVIGGAEAQTLPPGTGVDYHTPTAGPVQVDRRVVRAVHWLCLFADGRPLLDGRTEAGVTVEAVSCD